MSLLPKISLALTCSRLLFCFCGKINTPREKVKKKKNTKPSFVSLNSKSEPESGSVKVDGYMSVRKNLKQAGWVSV